MNLNQLAKLVSDFEGKKEEVTIAQIKEVISVMGIIFSDLDHEDLFALLSRMCRK